MFWAVFGHGVHSKLVAVNGDPEATRGGVTACVYRSVLAEYLPIVMDADSIFMHDNVKIHQAYTIRK